MKKTKKQLEEEVEKLKKENERLNKILEFYIAEDLEAARFGDLLDTQLTDINELLRHKGKPPWSN